MEYFLKQIEPGNPFPLLISLHEEEMKIGRSTVTSLSSYPKVSRYHASFTRKNDSWFITDLKSMNCLYVNFERIQQPVQLNVGDIIGFGSPNVSQDGGFVCVLAARSKVNVKREPSDDDECVEIPIDSNDNISINSSFSINESNTVNECITSQHIHNKTDVSNISNIDLSIKNLLSISSEHPDFKICKSESFFDMHQSVDIHPNRQTFTEQPSTTLNYPVNNTKGVNLNPIDFGTVSTSQKLNHTNTADLTNSRVEHVIAYDNASSEAIIPKPLEHNNDPNRPHAIHESTQSSLIDAYPGIEYLEGLEEFRSCNIFKTNGSSKNTDLENQIDQVQDSNIKVNFNPTNVKQEYSEELITDLGANLKVKTKTFQDISEISENCIKSVQSATLQECDSIYDEDVKKSKEMNEHLLKDCAPSFICKNSIHLPNDPVKLKKSSDHSVSSQSSSHENCNWTKNVKVNVSHSKGYSKEISESSTSLTEQSKHPTLKQKHNKSEIDNEVNSTKTTQLQTFFLSNQKSHESNESLPKISQDCNIQLKKYDSTNTQISLNAAEANSPDMCTAKDKLDDNSSELQMGKNSIEKPFKLNNTSPSKRNNFTVAVNLKVRKNKILSSESECEDENVDSFFPQKSFIPTSRTKQKNGKHHKANPASKRSKTKKVKTGEFGSSPDSEIPYSPLSASKETGELNIVPIATSIVRSKRRYSWSDYSDEYPRSRSPSANENNPQEKKCKSVGRTLLIDFKPMEYRSRKLRGREEWFQEQTGAVGAETVFQTSKHESCSRKDLHAKKSHAKSYETVKSVSEHSRTRKQKICSQKREEKIKSKEISQKRRHGSQKIAGDNSQKNTLNDSVRKRTMPPVPRRKHSFCSRMGFLLDAQVNNDIKSINNDKQKVVKEKKLDAPKDLDIPSLHSKLQLDLSLEFDLSSDKKQTQTYENNQVKHNFTKTLTDSKAEKSAQHSISNSKEHSKENIYKHEPEKWIPISELDSRQSNTSEKSSGADQVPDLNTLKTTTREGMQSKDMNYLLKSKKEVTVSPNHQIAKDSTKFRHDARITKYYQASSTLLMKMIVSWNPKWLVEQKKNKNPPPIIAQGASSLNLSFSSYESYVSSYFPMIVLEVWECLFRECCQHIVFEQLENCNDFCYTIKAWENREGLTELKCESVVSDTLCYHPIEGKIVLLNVKEKQERRLENYTFGFIRSHSIEELKQFAPEWNTVPVEALKNAKLVKFEVVIKKSKIPIQLNTVYLAHGLSDIKQKLQMADALRSFRHSSLCKDIYHPREEALMFCNSSRESHSWDNQAISEVVQNPISKTKVLLLQAPPGTGKTKCVVELVKKLTFGNSTKFKVLVCAPSYTSLDEILCGLIQSNENCSNSKDLMKLVRLGEDDGISGNLKAYSLTAKVAKLYREDCVKKMHNRECSLRLLEEKINDILFKQQTSQDMYTKINKSTSLKALVDKLESLKSKNLLHHMDEGCQKGYECIILQESDVLLSILDCSMFPAVITFLKGESSAYCIVDEAAQCNELQILQCLHHEKIEKLILFGDPQQQKPATISKCAAKCGFDRSIFERFFQHYKKKFHKIPCPTFNKQYRMHSEICKFPSKYFYNQKLSTADGTDKRYANFPLKPYTVLDVLDPGPIPDDTESSLIMYICSLLVQACPTSTIGIILAEEEQKHGLSLPQDPEYNAIEIDILEKFHGKEKDIILIPCIRKPSTIDEESIISCGKMLNVALTRAKQCLIICGQIASKVEYPHWRALMDDALARNCYLCVASVTHLPLVFANYIKKV